MLNTALSFQTSNINDQLRYRLRKSSTRVGQIVTVHVNQVVNVYSLKRSENLAYSTTRNPYRSGELSATRRKTYQSVVKGLVNTGRY